MYRNSSTGSTRRIRSVHVVAAGAIVLAMGGSATAAAVVTGKQIKDNSVTSKDIKNGSLLLKDFKSSEAAKLRGPAGATGATGPAGKNGTNGTNGAPGASAFAPPPSGTMIKGGGILNVELNGAGVAIRDYAPLPITTAAPLDDSGTGRNIYFGPGSTASLSPSEVNETLCAGTFDAPNPTAGNLCVYVSQASNVTASSAELYAGSNAFNDAADASGFYLLASSNAAGAMTVRYVWAYKAP